MSRGYRIRVPTPRTVHRASSTVSGTDELCVDVGLLPILGEAEMRELLRAELTAQGWVRTSGGGLKSDLGKGLTAELSPDGEQITVSTTSTREFQATGTSQADAERSAASQAAASKAAVERQSTVRLAKAESDVRATLEQAVQRVYIEALGRKARQLGEVQSVQHGTAADGTVEVTIKIRV
jgi:hypothetical protein